MKKHRSQRVTAALLSAAMGLTTWSAMLPTALTVSAATANNTAYNKSASNVVEYLDRGICAVKTDGGMLVSWRFLASDPDDAEFRLFRGSEQIYTSTSKDNSYSKGATCFLDKSGSASDTYRVECWSGTKRISNDTCKIASSAPYFDIKLSQPGSGYTPNDMSVGDVDGDGQYELFLKWDPDNSKDNSQKGKTGNVFIDCYRLDGTRLWRIDLGVNIRAGAHYTQFFVGDFDLDGKCEMTCKTADGTKDGTGKVIGDASKDYRDGNGFIYTGPEYYTLFDGATGAALDTIDYEPGRGDPTKWGKTSDKTNRVDRFWGTVAYLDGVHPSVVTGRGYYGRLTATAYTVENKKLKKLWMYDSGTSNSSTNAYGDGNHNTMAADVDNDGKQEIITGPAIIDDNGKLYYTTKQGHGDAMHVGDLDPTNPGIEVYICHEEKGSGYGVTLYDADQKKIIFHHNNADGDTGRCCGDNVWANNPGAELWGNKENGGTPVLDVAGNTLSCRRPAINFLSYWDGDLEREILDGYTDSPATITKMKEDGTLTTLLSTDGYYTCNTTKGTPCLSADIFGDWREELIVRKASGDGIRIYTTTYDTDYRVQCLMHDPQYRMQISSQQTAYNQPPHTSFFLGTGYDMPARPQCTVNAGGSAALEPGAVLNEGAVYQLRNVNSGLYMTLDPDAENDVVQKADGLTGWTVEDAGDGYYRLYSEYGDGRTYLLDLDYGQTDNGTNIHVWTDTQNDAQLFKLIDNGDGTYALTTKNTQDGSCAGVTAASKDAGTSIIEWSRNDSADQKWILEVRGETVSALQVLDHTYLPFWSLNDSLAVGDVLFGDRDFTYTSLPEALIGSEAIVTACDAKKTDADLASVTVAADSTVYVALDQRQETVPAWLGAFTKTGDTVTSSNDVVFDVYAKSVSAGETVTLGTNGGSYNVVNYVAMVQKAAPAPTEPDTTEPTPTEPTPTEPDTTEPDTTEPTPTEPDTTEPTPTEPDTTEPAPTESGDVLYGDADEDGKVDIMDVILLNKSILGSATLGAQGKINSDVDRNDAIDTTDALNVLKAVVKLVTLPV